MSMVEINLNNVEELIFHNRDFADKIPDFRGYYDQWRLGRMTAALKSVGQKSLVDFLNNITEQQTLKIEELLGEKVKIDCPKMSNIKSYTMDITELDDFMNQNSPYGYPRMYRKGTKIFITIWR